MGGECSSNITTFSAEKPLVAAPDAELAEEFLGTEKENADANISASVAPVKVKVPAAEEATSDSLPAEGNTSAGAPGTGQLLTAKTGRQLREEVLQVGKTVKLDVGSQSAF